MSVRTANKGLTGRKSLQEGKQGRPFPPDDSGGAIRGRGIVGRSTGSAPRSNTVYHRGIISQVIMSKCFAFADLAGRGKRPVTDGWHPEALLHAKTPVTPFPDADVVLCEAHPIHP